MTPLGPAPDQGIIYAERCNCGACRSYQWRTLQRFYERTLECVSLSQLQIESDKVKLIKTVNLRRANMFCLLFRGMHLALDMEERKHLDYSILIEILIEP